MAYGKINLGLMDKEIAERLGLPIKTAEYHWNMAKRIIRGHKLKTV